MNQEYKCYDNFDICGEYLSKECQETCPYVKRMERFADVLARVSPPRCRTGLERFIHREEHAKQLGYSWGYNEKIG